MGRLALIALAASAAAAPLAAQTVPDPNPYYGVPQGGMAPPPPAVHAPPPPGVSWRQPAPGTRVHVYGTPPGAGHVYGTPPADMRGAAGVTTRTWVEHGAPPPPGMGGGMHHGDGPPPPPMDGRHHDGGAYGGGYGRGYDHDGRGYDGRDRDGRGEMRRHVEIRRYGRGPGFVAPGVGWEGGWQGGYAMEGAPMMPPPPPCPGPCGPRGPAYGYGYAYGGGGAVLVTETTVTEAPVVERRVYYTTHRVRVAPRHHVVRRACRCKLVKAAPRAGERG